MKEIDIQKWLLTFDCDIRKIAGYDKYYITENGDIYSTLYNKAIKRKLSYDGKSMTDVIVLTKDRKPKTHHVRYLVFDTFTSDYVCDKECLIPKDGNHRNNHIDNLEKTTMKKVIQDQFKNGRKGVITHSTISKEEACKIRSLTKIYHGYGANLKISKMFNVSSSTVCHIRYNKIWKEL